MQIPISKHKIKKTKLLFKIIALIFKITVVTYIIIIFHIILNIVFYQILSNYRIEYYLNWDIWLNKAEKTEEIFVDGWLDPTTFTILYYNEDEIKKIISKEYIQPIEDTDFIKEKLRKDYKVFFDKYQVMEMYNKIEQDVIKEENYYGYIKDNNKRGIYDDREYSLLIIDNRMNIMYVFEYFTWHLKMSKPNCIKQWTICRRLCILGTQKMSFLKKKQDMISINGLIYYRE